MDCMVRGVAKNQTQLSDFHFNFAPLPRGSQETPDWGEMPHEEAASSWPPPSPARGGRDAEGRGSLQEKVPWTGDLNLASPPTPPAPGLPAPLRRAGGRRGPARHRCRLTRCCRWASGTPSLSLWQGLPRAGAQAPGRPMGPPALLRGADWRQSPARRPGPGRPPAPLAGSLLWAFLQQQAGALPWLPARLPPPPHIRRSGPGPGWKGPFWHRPHGLTPFPLLFPQQGLWPLVPGSHAHLTSHWDVARVCPHLPLKVSSCHALAKGLAHRSLGLPGLARVPVSMEHLPATAALPRRGLAAHTLALLLATVAPWRSGGEPCLTRSQQPCAILPDQGVLARPGPRKKEPRAGSPAPLQRMPTSPAPSRRLPPPSSRRTGSTSLLASSAPQLLAHIQRGQGEEGSLLPAPPPR